MKKIILTIVAVCAVAITGASAQDFSYGAKVGMNVSSIGGDFKDDNTSARVGFTVGVMAEYALSEKSSVGAELLYSLQGCKEEWDSEKSTVNLSYLNIPILYSYNVFGGLSVKAGIQPGFLLSSKVKYDGESYDFDEFYFGIGTKTFSFAIPVGVSYTFAEKIMVDARYNIACTNVVDYDNFTSKNSNFQLSVGYMF